MFIIYALKFIFGRIYIGQTGKIEQRIKDHKNQRVKSTKNRGEFRVLNIENCSTRSEARNREKYWKSGCGKEQLKKLEW
jgi:putative endonuclease